MGVSALDRSVGALARTAMRPPSASISMLAPQVSTPSPAYVLAAVAALAVVACATAGRLAAHLRRSSAGAAPFGPVHVSARGAVVAAGAAALILVPLSFGEATVYKFGLVLIFIVGAVGLHLLVNWAGELSLAHAAMVGLPAFVVAKLSADHGLSPLLLLPVGLGVGLAAGAVIGLPAIRTRGLQVALVTLAAGVAVDRFFFTKDWIVGGVAGAAVATPRLGPVAFTTARSLYPVLAVLFLLSVGAAGLIYRSKVGRALLWTKAHPEAASAFGVPAAHYRALAYSLAGGFAGFSGGLTAMWVQHLPPQAFPLNRSFTYLIVVALAGRGFVGGVAAAAALVEGGRLFLPNADAVLAYGAPLGLILTLTRQGAGLNGLGRQLADGLHQLNRREPHVNREIKGLSVRPLIVLSVTIAAVGFAAISLAWYHAGNTRQVWIQNQELISGGLGGLALVVLGMGLLVADRVTASRAAEAERWEQLVAALRRDILDASVTPTPSTNSRRRRPLVTTSSS